MAADTSPISATTKGFAAACVVVMCWSGFNIVSRIAGKSALTAFDLAALRFGVASLILFPLFVGVLRRASLIDIQRYAVIALFGSIGYALLAYSGFMFAPAAHAGVLVNGGIPFATAMIGWLFLGQRPQGRSGLGLLIALSGICLIAVQSLTHADTPTASRQWIGDVFFFAAAISWAVAGLLMRKWQLRAIETTASMVSISMLVYLPIYFLFLPKAIDQVSTSAVLLQAGYQGIVAATMAGIFYNYANQTIGPQKASFMLALVPGVTAVLAVPILGETLLPLTIAGVILVTCGALVGATQRSS